MNLYARPSVVYRQIAGKTYSATDTDLAAYLDDIERASRECDGHCGRAFWALTATRYFNWTGNAASPHHDPRRLELRCDLVSISSLTVDDDDDGTYDVTLVAGTDYVTEPANALPNTPIRSLYLLRTGTQMAAWPRWSRAVKVTGVWGYSAELEDTGTTAAEALDSSETGLDVVAGTAVDVGETIYIESEAMYVSAISTNTLTVVRGVNGTTAAAHDTALAVYRRRYPRDIEDSVRVQVGRYRWVAQQGFDGQISEFDNAGRREWAQVRSTWDRYIDPANAHMPGGRLGVA